MTSAAAQTDRRVVHVGDHRVEMEVAGDGPAVVLLASLGRSAVADYGVVAAGLCAAGHTSVSLELPAVGASSPPAENADLHAIAGVVAQACSAAGIDRAHVVGHAFGNRVARCVAAGHPELVQSLTLLAAGGSVPGDPDALAALVRCFDFEIPEAERLQAVQTAFFAPGNDPSGWNDGWWPAAAAAQSAAVHRTPLESWWSNFTVPTLVVQGLADRVAPPANGWALVRELTERGVRARAMDVEGAGHALLPERPEVLTKAVAAFIAGACC